MINKFDKSNIEMSLLKGIEKNETQRQQNQSVFENEIEHENQCYTNNYMRVYMCSAMTSIRFWQRWKLNCTPWEFSQRSLLTQLWDRNAQLN